MTIDPILALEWACVAAVGAMVVFSFLRHQKTFAKLTKTHEDTLAKLEEAKDLLQHANELDQLLAHLCVQAYANAHMPIWKAWGVMGTISVTAERKLPTELD